MTSTPVRIAVAAPNELSARAALDIAAGGGNAVDACIAAAAVASISEPGIVAPLAGGFINVWEPGREPLVIDANVEMPGRGLPRERFGAGVREIALDYGGGITVYGGHGSVATPGLFAGYDEANRRWGRLPWSPLLEPAIAVAQDGFPLGAAAASYLAVSGRSLFGWQDQTATWLGQGTPGTVPVAGDVLRSPDLANSLRTLADRGVGALYGGDLGEVIAADMATGGGLITLDDLRAYRTVTRPALRARLGDWDVAINPGPSIGGPVLTAMLRLLGHLPGPAGNEPSTAPTVGDLVQIQRTVLAHRHRHIDAADDLQAAGAELLRVLDDHGPEGLAAMSTSADTMHISVVDDTGLACSITGSAGYGSGVTTPETGLQHNNALGEPELNRRGLHALPPGTRLASNMAPTTARHPDGAVLAIGTPGADRITTSLFQVLAAYCLQGRSVEDAISAPRVHVAFDSEGRSSVHAEEDPAHADEVAAAAAATGSPVVHHPMPDMYFGGVAAARYARGQRDDLVAAGDLRRGTAIAVS